MKTLFITLFSISAFLFGACSDSGDADLQKIEEAAKRDVSKVAEALEGSMQREHAVLAIRVREHALREAGYDNEADKYIEIAGNLLIDSLRIIEPLTAVN